MNVYAIKDKRTNEYQQPLVFAHVAEASRFFEDLVNNPQTQLAKWPLDFQLDQIGTYDQKTGKVTHLQQEICQIIDLKKKRTDTTIMTQWNLSDE